MPAWYLIDADPIVAEHKYTFYKPSPKIIGKLRPGDSVKLIFGLNSPDQEAPRGERM